MSHVDQLRLIDKSWQKQLFKNSFAFCKDQIQREKINFWRNGGIAEIANSDKLRIIGGMRDFLREFGRVWCERRSAAALRFRLMAAAMPSCSAPA